MEYTNTVNQHKVYKKLCQNRKTCLWVTNLESEMSSESILKYSKVIDGIIDTMHFPKFHC